MTASCRARIDRFVDLDAPPTEENDHSICPSALRALLATLTRRPDLDTPVLVSVPARPGR